MKNLDLISKLLLLVVLMAGSSLSLSAISLGQAEIPPLYFFYVNHTHVRQDFAPYTNPAFQQLDVRVADNILATIEAIAQRLEAHGIKASWEVVYGTAQGLCEYEGENHIFNRLIATGHEVGLHVHNHDDYERNYDSLVAGCGIEPSVTSGLRIGSADLAPQVGARRVANVINQNIEAFGVTTGTTNFGSTRFMEACGPNAMANSTREALGLQIFPWRVDAENAQFCEDSPNSEFVIVEHMEMNPWTGGSNANQPDLLTPEHFETLREFFDAALDYVDKNRPTELAAWGFSTHPHELMLGEDGENGPDPDAMAALDVFLEYVAERAAEGRVIFATAGEIADLVRSR